MQEEIDINAETVLTLGLFYPAAVQNAHLSRQAGHCTVLFLDPTSQHLGSETSQS